MSKEEKALTAVEACNGEEEEGAFDFDKAFEPVASSMHIYANRLGTFAGVDWPFKRRKCRPQTLAKAGFVYIGTETHFDLVECFMCGKQLDGWEPGDDPMKEHANHSPMCPLMTLSMEESRLATFQLWPRQGYISSPEEFARAGFSFQPTAESLDNLTCFKCNKSLDGWEYDDDPLIEHHSHNKRCTYVKAMMKKRQKEEANQSKKLAPQTERKSNNPDQGDLAAQSNKDELASGEKQEETDSEQIQEHAATQDTNREDAQSKTQEEGNIDDLNVEEGHDDEKKEEAEEDDDDSEQAPETVVKPTKRTKRVAKSTVKTSKRAKRTPLSNATNSCKEDDSSQQRTGAASLQDCRKTGTRVNEKQQAEMHTDVGRDASSTARVATDQQPVTSSSTLSAAFEDPSVQEMTVKDFLIEQKEVLLHQVVADAQSKIQDFRNRAQQTRLRLMGLLSGAPEADESG